LSGLTSTHGSRAHYCRIVLVLYLAAVALACSFILFEVLDIDGSDFQPLAPLLEARPAESHHDDVKRAILAVAVTALLSAPLASAVTPLRRPQRAAATASCFTPLLDAHVLLPRATLSDGPAA